MAEDVRQELSAGSDLIEAASEIRRRLPESEPSLKLCEFMATILLISHGVALRLRRLEFGFTTHHVLELPDGRILDPTADQFAALGSGLPPVYLGEVPEIYLRWTRPGQPDSDKNPAAVLLGRLGGLRGGPARAASLSPEKRQEIAKKAAAARWGSE